MNHKLVGVVVTYKPESDVGDNIQRILEQVEHLVIVDNTADTSSDTILKSFLNSENVTIIKNTGNEGIARALNQGLKAGLQWGGDHFILFDQDSCPREFMIRHLQDAVLQSSLLVIAGPILEDRKTGTRDTEAVDIVPFAENMLITSGSFFSKAVIDKIGMMDEKLFIDYVDHDYCLRLKKAGGELLRVPKARLLHSFGEAEARTIFGKTFFVQAYSPLRRYYMARNRIILYLRYPQFTQRWFWHDLSFVIKDYVKLIVFEKDRFKKIFAIVNGVFDGLKIIVKRSAR